MGLRAGMARRETCGIRRAMSAETNKLTNAKRRLPWFAVCCVVGVAFVGTVLAYELWMRASIAKITTIRVLSVSTIALRCSPDHFWGQSILYKRLADDNERYGALCRDWRTHRWILRD